MPHSASHENDPAALAWVLDGGGAAAELIRRIDWASTPLGPMASWSHSLKNTVATLLHSRHPMFLWWGHDLIQIYNDAYTPSFGEGKHPAAMGQPGRECWPEIWPIIGPQIDDVMQRGISSWHEDALVPINRNGTVEDVYWTYGYSPVFDDDGTIAGTLVVCTETTSRVVTSQRETALRAEMDRERRRLHEFFAQAPAGICILTGHDLRFEFANDYYRKLAGGRELVGKPLLEALPELAGQGLDTLMHAVVENRRPLAGREVHVRLDRDGSGVPSDAYFTFIYSPLRDASTGIDGVIVLALDVTDEVVAKRNAEELARRLVESEAKFQHMAESIAQLAWSAQPDGSIDWYNQRWYDYTGTTFDDMKGWGWKTVHDPDRVEEIATKWQASLDTGEPFEMEFTLRGQDGIDRWYLTRAMPFRDDAGNLVRWFGTNTDIHWLRESERERAILLDNEQRARMAAEFASRAKDDFLSTASHELRTPLNAILGWSKLLQGGQLDQNAYVRAVDSIERNARVQVRLIEDILDGSRIITGQLHLEIRPLDLTAVVGAAIDAVRAAADAKRINLTVLVDPAAARVVGDPDRLQQVIWNLANNAIKFTPKEGQVSVSLDRAGTDIQLTVRDTGEGIEPEFLPHVFERFRQAEGSSSRRYGGLGLGLALVRHLVEAHGGSVRAESDGIGRGATFVVMLPVQAVFAETPAAPLEAIVEPMFVPRAANLHGATVLVVDDEADARDLVATALRSKGADVTTAASATEAIDLVVTRDFMAMVSDVGMPGIDGYEMIRRIRTTTGVRGAHLPTVALTAYSREEDRRRALEAGFNAYLSKPVEPDQLVDVVAGLVTAGHTPESTAPGAIALRADTLSKFERILNAQGLHQALRFLNSRTAHRFTGIYRFDPPTLRNLALHDADDAARIVGDDAPMEATYCSIVGAFERPFSTADAMHDERLRSHPAREQVRSYFGVLLRTLDGKAFGTLCHFDVVSCEVPVAELALMEAAAALIMRAGTLDS